MGCSRLVERASVVFLPAPVRARVVVQIINNGPLLDDHVELSDRHERHVFNASRS